MTPKNIKRKIGEFANIASKKTEEIADLATLKLKIAKVTSDRESELLKLGKLTYKKLSTENNPHEKELSDKISRSMEYIRNMTVQIKDLKGEYEKRKNEIEAQKKAKQKSRDEFGDDEINTVILDSFKSSENE